MVLRWVTSPGQAEAMQKGAKQKLGEQNYTTLSHILIITNNCEKQAYK
jgi:hypothetical protein